MITLNEIAYNIRNLAYGGKNSSENNISLSQIKHWIHYHRAKLIADNINKGITNNQGLYQDMDITVGNSAQKNINAWFQSYINGLASDGVSSLVDGDIWVDGSDLENYPRIYKRASSAWVLLDNADQHSPDGIVFADFRNSSSSNALITAAPASTSFPANFLGWNKLLSSGNVKKYNTTTGLW